MAEAGFGLAASVTALGGFLITLARLAREVKDSSSDLQRYNMVLESIHRTTSLMIYFAESSESVPNLAMSINGREESIIQFCSRSVESLVLDIKKLTETLEYYSSRRTLRGDLLQKIKRFFMRTPSSLAFFINRNHISELIQAAKLIESSLHHSLSIILLASNEIEAGITQNMISHLHNPIITQSNQFQAWRQNFDQINPIVVYLRAKKEKPKSKKERPKHILPKFFRSHQQSSKDDLSAMVTPPSSSNVGLCDLSRTDLSLKTTDNEDLGESVAVVRHDGAFNPSHYLGQFPSSIEELPLDQADQNAITCDPHENHNEYATEEFPFSQSEYFPMSSDNEGSICSNVIYDKSEQDLDTSVEAFIDGAIEIASCLRNSDGSLLFCVRTIIVHDTSSPVFILKKPCVSNTCNHVSVHATGNIPLEHQTPFLARLNLRQWQEGSSADIQSLDQGHLKLVTVPRCRVKGIATLILCQSGCYKQYADGVSLNADISLDIQHDHREFDYSDTSLDSDAISEDVADEENVEEKIASIDKDKVVGTNFTRLPCLFCREDALEPRLDASGSAAFVFARNESFGYTCQRCEDRTWISAIEYGLNFFGGAWTWRSN